MPICRCWSEQEIEKAPCDPLSSGQADAERKKAAKKTPHLPPDVVFSVAKITFSSVTAVCRCPKAPSMVVSPLAGFSCFSLYHKKLKGRYGRCNIAMSKIGLKGRACVFCDRFCSFCACLYSAFSAFPGRGISGISSSAITCSICSIFCSSSGLNRALIRSITVDR